MRKGLITKSFSIYTKTGDMGQSSLYSNKRHFKDDKVFHALGSLDELNSFIGLARQYTIQSKLERVSKELNGIQSRLQEINSHVAFPRNTSMENKKKLKDMLVKTEFKQQHTPNLEENIDFYMQNLPPLKNFILPGGGIAASHLHVCRSICRRVERILVPLLACNEINNDVFIFINRLSDYFFAAARYVTYQDGNEDGIYNIGLK